MVICAYTDPISTSVEIRCSTKHKIKYNNITKTKNMDTKNVKDRFPCDDEQVEIIKEIVK